MASCHHAESRGPGQRLRSPLAPEQPADALAGKMLRRGSGTWEHRAGNPGSGSGVFLEQELLLKRSGT